MHVGDSLRLECYVLSIPHLQPLRTQEVFQVKFLIWNRRNQVFQRNLYFSPAIVSRESYHHWVFSQPKTGWCSTLTLLRLFARHSRENGHLLLADWSSTFGTTLASTGGRHRGNLQRKVETYRRICTSVFIANVEIKCDSSDGRDLEYENMILCKADPLSMRDVTWWAALDRAGSAKPAWSNWSPFEQITQLLKARLFE